MKKTTKLLCGLLGVGLLLTGCATVGAIKNNDPELIYNGNSAVMINDSYYYITVSVIHKRGHCTTLRNLSSN